MTRSLVAGLALATAMAMPAAARQVGSGEWEYMVACAGCHGESAIGDGPLAGLMDVETPDLTHLTRDAGGTFPFRKVLSIVDGRNDGRRHGSEMPIRGERYLTDLRIGDATGRMVVGDPELVAQGRLLALVRYPETIQQE